MNKLLVALHLTCRVDHIQSKENIIKEVQEVFNCGHMVVGVLESYDKNKDKGKGRILTVDALNPHFATGEGAEDGVVFQEMAHRLLEKHPEGRISFTARKFDESYGEPVHEFTSGIVVVAADAPVAKEEAVPAEAVTA